jgi:hypothetical protein
MKFAVRELDKLRAQGHDPTEVLEQSVYRDWAGLFALRINGSAVSNRQESLEERNRKTTEGWRPPEMRGSNAGR